MTETFELEEVNACCFCGRRGVYDVTRDGRLHCYRDGCMRRAAG